jgi:transcriptional regulator with PAS, ATPase and Fis domain
MIGDGLSGGTLFLDEILGLPLSLQAILLRALQEKAIRRVGGHKVIPVDVRIIAAANRNIRLAVKEGSFRDDLFYRLNVLTLSIPPLRERSEDIPLLLDHFQQKYDANWKKAPNRLSRPELKKLMSHTWPGNVRELEHFVKKYVILTADETNYSFVSEELFAELLENTDYTDPNSTDTITIPVGTMKEMEERIIHTLSNKYPYDKSQLARKIGVNNQTRGRFLCLIFIKLRRSTDNCMLPLYLTVYHISSNSSGFPDKGTVPLSYFIWLKMGLRLGDDS